MMLPLAAVPFVMTIVMVLWVLTCLALVFLIMIQKGKGGGLSAAFGGGGGASSLFGAKTGDFLTWITISLAGVFLLLSVFMGLYYKPTVTAQETTPVTAPAPAQPQAPAQVPAGSQPQAPAQDSPVPPVEAPVSN